VTGKRFTLRYTNDTSLAQSFWENHAMTRRDQRGGDGRAIGADRRNRPLSRHRLSCLPFLRIAPPAMKLKRWAETGQFRPGGMFEHPVTQIGMAGLSAMLLWPFFGLNAKGLFLADADRCGRQRMSLATWRVSG
jgi:hypothetical protein